MNQETKEQKVIMVCQDPEGLQGRQENQGEMEPEGTQVMLDQEENLEQLDQRETLEDLALAILEQEGRRVRKERRETVGLVAAEGNVVRRVNPEKRDLGENQVSQDRKENLDQEDQEESSGAMEILDLREILASLSVTS